MSDDQQPAVASLNAGIQPPKELPNFFTQQKKVPPIVPPVPPQLHPPLQPAATVAAPTPGVSSLGDVTETSTTLELGNKGHEESESSALTEPQSTNADDKVASRGTDRPSRAIAVGLSEAESELDKLEQEDGNGSGVLGWLQKTVTHSSFLSKVADKAKTGMDSVLTTLDPGMKEFLKSEGSVDIVIGSDNGRIINAVADGFRHVFSSVSYRGMGTPGTTHLLPQIVGYPLALEYLNKRAQLLRASGLAGNKSAIVTVQPFLHNIEKIWYESVAIGIQKNDVEAHVFTQPVEVESDVIDALERHTPKGYAANAFAVTVGNGYAEVFGVDPDDWQFRLLSYSSSELYRLASTALASAFKRKLSVLSL